MKALTVDQLNDGCEKAVTNGKELLQEAMALYKIDRHARAAFLAFTALEEFAKAAVLFSVAMDIIDGKEIDWKHVGKDIRNHPAKTFLAYNMYLLDIKHRLGPKSEPALPRDDGTTKKVVAGFVERRLRSLYVDINDGQFQMPSEAISPEAAETLIGMAQLNLESYRHFPKMIEQRQGQK